MDLLNSFPPGYHKNERLRLRRPGENFRIFTHCLLTKLRREVSDIKSALHEKPACESSCGDRWIVAPQTGPVSEFRRIYIHRNCTHRTDEHAGRKKELRGTKIYRAVAIWMHPFEFGGAHVETKPSSSLNDTVCWDDPAVNRARDETHVFRAATSSSAISAGVLRCQ